MTYQITSLRALRASVVIISFYLALSLSILAQDQEIEPLPRIQPTAPESAADTFQLLNGFRMELLAAEPLVTDPVAMQYDENGLAYVVEMNDYPYTDTTLDVAWKEQTSASIGRIRVLEDTDADGRFDSSTVFAEGLSWPTGLAFWKGGVFVTATPDVWYLKDTDGDHRADIRRKVLTGFRKYNVQAVMNNLAWGLDHQIYAAGASNGGNISHDDNTDEKPTRLGRNDFRINPLTESFDILSGGARFGNTFDDVGNRFICNIRNPVQHIVLPQRYLARNPHLPVKQAVHDAAVAGDAIQVFRASPPEPWRVLNAARLASDTSRKSPRSEMHATGYVTSSSGITIYRGSAYPADYYGNAFICEVAGNIVMRYRMQPNGPTFTATRAHQKEEFLASTDNWCRPVNFVNAPDGTLHLLDMYRETIEHPWSIPDDIKARLDLQSGRNRGRIYRLAPPSYPAGHQPNRQPRLGIATTAELVAELENPNCWWRETAHRLLFERQDAAAIAPLKKLLRISKQPLARLHALWSLQGLGELNEDDLLTALADDSSSVRKHAVQLSEKHLDNSPKILTQVLACASDVDPIVRFQTALSLGESSAAEKNQIVQALAAILEQDHDNIWTRTAILSSLSGQESNLLVNLISSKNSSIMQSVTLNTLAEITGARGNPAEVIAILTALQEFPQSSTLSHVVSLGAGLQRAKKNFAKITNNSDPKSKKFIEQLFQTAIKNASNESETLDLRLQSIRLLGYGRLEGAKPTLNSLLDTRQPQEIQFAAVATLGQFTDPAIAPLLLEAYPQLTPNVRNEIITTLLARSERIAPLLNAIEAGQVARSQVSASQRRRLSLNRNENIRQHAEQLFAQDAPSPRDEVIQQYQASLTSAGNPIHGRKIFQRECLTCHRLGNEGHDVGINLATVKNRTAAELLTHILDPNREVSPNYFEYILVTDDGRTQTGVIATETATSITLRRPEGKQQTILRENIETITSTGISLMPEGLEKKITTAEMADLLAFLLEMKTD